MNKYLLIFFVAAAHLAAAPGGYLFVTFRGEKDPMGEQIYFAVSQDGRTWKALNRGEPALVSKVGEKGVRDPYILRSHDRSKYFIIATDLSIALNGNWKRAVQAGSHSLVIWESADLTHWSEPRLVAVAPEGAGCTWAPEAVYDEEKHDYLVFWASATRDDQFKKHRIWAARTKDFRQFSAPFVYIDKPTATIDTTIVRDGSRYYRFSKDEKLKAITMEWAGKLSGPWTEMSDFSLARLQGFEGPECYRVEDAGAKTPTWCLILDHYSENGGYKPFVTHDLAGGRFEPGEGFHFPFPFRHGSVLPLSADELARMESADRP